MLVNHWPSRYGGKEISEPSRIHVAGILRDHVDSLLSVDPCAAIVIMGDLNDGPEDKSVKKVLKGKSSKEGAACADLYNLSTDPRVAQAKGTHRYKAHWETFDQVLVSGILLDKNKGGKI